MKQLLCILVTLAASVGLLFLVSAPVNNLHGAESHEEETQVGQADTVTVSGDSVTLASH